MSIIGDITKTLGEVTQGISDAVVNGPDGPALRKELEMLLSALNESCETFAKLHDEVTAWEDPLNACANYTSSLLRQSSDYVHGLALSYQKILDDNALEVSTIRGLSEDNVVRPLVDIPIPGDFGGFPSALVPGVETLKMMEGLANAIASSINLKEQHQKALDACAKAESCVKDAKRTAGLMEQMKQYLLGIANQVLDIYRRTTGLTLPSFTASTSKELWETNRSMIDSISQITDVTGNAFRAVRFILNLIREKGIRSASPQQVTWITSTLFMYDDQIANAFQTRDNLEQFVRSFFDATLLTPAVLLQLPPAPPAIRPYLRETPSASEVHSDPDSQQYDPPSNIDTASFPS